MRFKMLKQWRRKVLIGGLAALTGLGTVTVPVVMNTAGTEVYAADNVAINETNFPDDYFRRFVKNELDEDGNGVLDSKEINNITYLGPDELPEGLESLKGIEFFSKLVYLDCRDFDLTELDVSKNTLLTYLDCSYNKLSELNLSANTKLRELHCHDNKLKKLDIKSTMLNDLYCGDNEISELLLNTASLQTLYCDNNRITSLDLKKNTGLQNFSCRGNNIAFLDLSGYNNLGYTDTDDVDSLSFQTRYAAINNKTIDLKSVDPNINPDKITAVYGAQRSGSSLTNVQGDVAVYSYDTGKGNMLVAVGNRYTAAGIPVNENNFPDPYFRRYVTNNCDTDKNNILDNHELNEIREIDNDYGDLDGAASLKGMEFFTNLRSLYVRDMGLAALDVSKNVQLENLYCNDNALSSLDLSTNVRLRSLYCSGNKLKKLDAGNTRLRELRCNNNEITDITLSKELTELYCSDNKIASMDVSKSINLQTVSCANNNIKSLDFTRHLDLNSLYCSGNNMISLNLNKNKLLYVDFDDLSMQTRSVNVKNGTVDLKEVDPNIDVSKISGLNGAKLSGTILNSIEGSVVTYDYATGRSDMGVALNIVPEKIAVTGVKLDKTALTLEAGKEQSIKATVSPANASDKKVTWSSSNTNVATVDSNGKVKAVKAGTAKITVTTNDGKKTAVCNITVTQPKQFVVVYHSDDNAAADKKQTTVKFGTLTQTMTVSELGFGSSDKEFTGWKVYREKDDKWYLRDSSGNKAFKKLENGKLPSGHSYVLYKDGEQVKQTADSGKVHFYAQWKVKKTAVTSVKLNVSNILMPVGQTKKLTATISPSNATEKGVTWKSTDTKIATVDQNGNVKAVGQGLTTVSAVTKDGNKIANCKVRVQFSDVTNTKSWEYDPVYWAADNGITTGSGGKFAPAGNCTREQTVTFIWRMWGSPAPKNMNSKFSDVKNKNSYSYKAIMWANENGVVSGSGGKFAPGGVCTREQIVTILWRLAGKPEPRTTNSPFSDVQNKKSYSYKAILWASENGITTGAGGKFAPANKCLRREMVTFLHRYNKLYHVI